jgi:hypothetical protein
LIRSTESGNAELFLFAWELPSSESQQGRSDRWSLDFAVDQLIDGRFPTTPEVLKLVSMAAIG